MIGWRGKGYWAGLLAKDAGWPLDRLAQGPLSPGTQYFSPETYPTYAPDKAKQLIQDYLADRRKRLGEDADNPHRIRYKALTL